MPVRRRLPLILLKTKPKMDLLIMIQKWIIKRTVQKWTGSNLSREKVLEMPPAAEPEFSQATGTHGNLPTQKLASIYKITKKTNYKITLHINDEPTPFFMYFFISNYSKLRITFWKFQKRHEISKNIFVFSWIFVTTSITSGDISKNEINLI